jgi:hypothetical protein
MEIATIVVMNADNLIMTATLAQATDVIGAQAMRHATVRQFMTLVEWTISFLVATVQALTLSSQATAEQHPERKKRRERDYILEWNPI